MCCGGFMARTRRAVGGMRVSLEPGSFAPGRSRCGLQLATTRTADCAFTAHVYLLWGPARRAASLCRGRRQTLLLLRRAFLLPGHRARRDSNPIARARFRLVEPKRTTGLEPATLGLGSQCSTD